MPQLEALRSFRDPDGYVFERDGRIFRCVLPHAAADLQAFLATPLAQKWMADGSLVSSRVVNDLYGTKLPSNFPSGAIIVEHSPIPFRNFPYEWAPEMLRSAAMLTLEMASAAMAAGFALKDATPYNIMFDGPRPVFLDVLSFRRRDALESIWQPHAQFIRTFAYPLLACSQFGLRMDEILLTHRDGLEPERLLALCPPYRRLLPPFLTAVTIPTLLGRGNNGAEADPYRVRHARDAEEATFILQRLFRRARRLVGLRAGRRRRGTTWQYMDSGLPYAPAEFAEKQRLLADTLARWPVRNLLDLGCNTGHFSLLAARYGARVVAIDRDADAIGALWQSASTVSTVVLPLVVDIGRPPGACGWQNSECTAFLDRARGKFDCVLMLALIHHLLVNERVPLVAILQLAAELTTHLAVVEYIDPQDAQFQRIARGRDALHHDVTRDNFEATVRAWFQILDAKDVSPTRRIYVLRKSAD